MASLGAVLSRNRCEMRFEFAMKYSPAIRDQGRIYSHSGDSATRSAYGHRHCADVNDRQVIRWAVVGDQHDSRESKVGLRPSRLRKFDSGRANDKISLPFDGNLRRAEN